MQQQFEEAGSRNAPQRLRCVRQITEADEETLQIVSSVLDRMNPGPKPERKKSARTLPPEAEKGGSA
jgi:hypothetical protein